MSYYPHYTIDSASPVSSPADPALTRAWTTLETQYLIQSIKPLYFRLIETQENKVKRKLWLEVLINHSKRFPGRNLKAIKSRWFRIISDFEIAEHASATSDFHDDLRPIFEMTRAQHPEVVASSFTGITRKLDFESEDDDDSDEESSAGVNKRKKKKRKSNSAEAIFAEKMLVYLKERDKIQDKRRERERKEFLEMVEKRLLEEEFRRKELKLREERQDQFNQNLLKLLSELIKAHQIQAQKAKNPSPSNQPSNSKPHKESPPTTTCESDQIDANETSSISHRQTSIQELTRSDAQFGNEIQDTSAPVRTHISTKDLIHPCDPSDSNDPPSNPSLDDHPVASPHPSQEPTQTQDESNAPDNITQPSDDAVGLCEDANSENISKGNDPSTEGNPSSPSKATEQECPKDSKSYHYSDQVVQSPIFDRHQKNEDKFQECVEKN